MKKLYKLDAPADGVFEEYDDLDDALAAADELVELWRKQARDDGEWDEEVECITISKIIYRAKLAGDEDQGFDCRMESQEVPS